GKPMIYVRKAPKQVGTGKLIEGEVKEGDVVVVIDDVATTGGSLIRAVKSIREEKGIVRSAVVFVDREQGAKEALKQLEVELIAIFTVTQLFESLFKKGYIDAEVYNKVMRYISGG
ncbi:MAG: phosphoribosyltransferase family protein, partial [Candidatus Geothermarchaeota archaeon]